MRPKADFFFRGQWPSTNYIYERLSAGSLHWTDATHSQIIEFTSSGSSSWGQWPGILTWKNKKFDQIGMYNTILPEPMEDQEKKWSEKIFGINFLFTCIQFLDCNSCTMLFKHSQFRLWIRDWVFHPLVVKNWPKKEEKLDKQVEVIFTDTVQKERLFTLFCMSSVTCIIKTFSSIPSKRKFKGIERLKLNILSKTTGTPGSYD